MRRIFSYISYLSFFFLFTVGVVKVFQLNYLDGLNQNQFYMSLIGFAYLICFSFLISLFKKNTFKDLIVCLVLLAGFLPIILNSLFFIPPSDPIYHGFSLWNSMEENFWDSANRAYLNKALFISISNFFTPYDFLSRHSLLLAFHVFSSSLMIISGYFSGRIYGLNKKWSAFSVLLMVLFFGTNRFAYFSYYTLAPSSINFSLLWLLNSLIISTVFRFYTRLLFYDLLKMLFISISLAPILFYNHNQEAGFLFILLVITFLIVIIKYIGTLKIRFKKLFFFIALAFCFIPYSIFFNEQKYIFHLPSDKLEKFSGFYFSIGHVWLIANIRAPRIIDTLGILGFLPAIFLIGTFFHSRYKYSINYFQKIFFQMKYILPGILPFLVFFIPSLYLIWISGIRSPGEHWRICYLSQYWITIAFALFKMEQYMNTRFTLTVMK